MIMIGQLARLLGITPRTLRHYDAIGLFPPAFIDAENGYRYYRPEQIARLERILHLRRLDMPLEDIQSLCHRQVLDDAEAFAAFLRKYRSTLVHQIAERSRLLDELDRFISLIEKGKTMLQDPVIVDLPAFELTGLSCICRDATPIPALWDRFLPRCADIIAPSQPPACFGVCERVDGERFRYFAGSGTQPGAPVPAGMERLQIPAQHYARFTHHGPLAGFGETLSQIWGGLESRWQLTPTHGPDLEHYDARYTGPDRADSSIDIYIPVEPK